MANSPSGESVIDRVVRILDTFSADLTVQTAAEIGRRADLPSASAHRIVDDLIGAGLLERDEDHRVRLGLRLWELALRGSTALRLRQAALPHMERIQSEVAQHTQLAVLERDEALFLERLSAPSAGANITRVAGRLPLHASSSGLVLLAHADLATRERVLAGPLRPLSPDTVTEPARLRGILAEIRRAGQVIAPGTVAGVSTGVAVPIRDAGRVVAALSVVLPREHPVDGALHALRTAADGIESALRSSGTIGG